MRVRKFNESLNEGKPEFGDYVLCTNDDRSDDLDEINNFVETNIGKVVDDQSILYKGYPYLVKYNSIPTNLKIFSIDEKGNSNKMIFNDSEISHWSKNIEDLEKILFAKKFNV